MVNFSPVTLLQSKLFRALATNSRSISQNELSKSAVIFSPHFDDETLGCGGAILKKNRCGADVKVVFMTDGRSSHNRWMQEDRLCTLRRSEGIAAVDKLGVKGKNVQTWGYPDTRLLEYADQASERVRDLLLLYKPEQIFLPYSGEPLMFSSDHIATTKIVLDAVRVCSLPFTVYEYPIWAWFHFPWIRIHRKHIRTFLRNSFHYRLGYKLIRDMNLIVDISDALDQKRIALEQHRSQVTELMPGVGWPTLGQVSGGDFLKIFFRKNEYYKTYEIGHLTA